MDAEVTLFELDAGRVPMKSLVNGIGTLTEVGEDAWELDISRWDDVAILYVGRAARLGGGEFGMMDANKEFFSLIIPSISV